MNDRIIIGLIGNETQKQSFISEFPERQQVDKVSGCFLIDNKFLIDPLKGFDSEGSISHYPIKLLNGIQVIIYLSPSVLQKAEVEIKRKKTKCIAIDFNQIEPNPRECLNWIGSYIPELNYKKMLVRSNYYSFFVLPDEVRNLINCYQDALTIPGRIITEVHAPKILKEEISQKRRLVCNIF